MELICSHTLLHVTPINRDREFVKIMKILGFFYWYFKYDF